MNADAILQNLIAHVDACERIYVAYSGGLDSSVLLNLLARSPLASRLTAIHIHHGLSPHADRWAKHCQIECNKRGIELLMHRVEVVSEGRGIEQAARNLRYRCFAQSVGNKDVLVTAHHQDDQAETLLYRLLRGTGLKGLGGMKGQTRLGDLNILRPFLDCTRRQLETYAETEGVSWVEDESNASDDYDRNYIRQHIAPVFEKRWPQFAAKFAQSSRHLAESERLLHAYVEEDLKSLTRRSERVGESIELESFLSYSRARQKAVLQRWCEKLQFDTPNTAHLEKLDEILRAKEDARPCLNWGHTELRRFNGRLYLLPKIVYSAPELQVWDLKGEVALGQGFILRCENADATSLPHAVEIRSKKHVERCRPLTRRHSQTMKKLLQEYKVEPWLRDCVPCVFVQGELAAVADLWTCEVSALETALRLRWEYQPFKAN